MKAIKKIAFLFSALLAIFGTAMEYKQEYVRPAVTGVNISYDKHIKLVFMGKTGAGKSTMINAFYNYANKRLWNTYPKDFPIPTEFAKCNVREYKDRKFENHDKGQLGAVTQEPSEYIARSDTYVLSLIDCPGTADTRGIEQDSRNTKMIAEFLANVGEFNAICLVLPIALNRETAEARYFIEQLKTIIPKTALNRIFICVSFSTADNENIKAFARSVGLPDDNIFNFDNFALTKDGYFDTVNIPLEVNDRNLDDPFSEDTESIGEISRSIAKVKKVKEAWDSSRREFNRMLRAARELGKYTTAEMAEISNIKNSVLEKIVLAHQKIDAIEKTEADLEKANLELLRAQNAYNLASETKNSSEMALRQAQLEKLEADTLKLYDTYEDIEPDKTTKHNTVCINCRVVCHLECGLDDRGSEETSHLPGCSAMKDNRCKECEGKCSYTFHRHRFETYRRVTKSRERPGVRNRQDSASQAFDKHQDELKSKSRDLDAKERVKNQRSDVQKQVSAMLDSLKSEKKCLQEQIVSLYVKLGQVSIASINFHIGEYYDICIRKEEDPSKQAKLHRDRAFYVEQVELYKQSTSNN